MISGVRRSSGEKEAPVPDFYTLSSMQARQVSRSFRGRKLSHILLECCAHLRSGDPRPASYIGASQADHTGAASMTSGTGSMAKIEWPASIECVV